jgi:hypothetical protein
MIFVQTHAPALDRWQEMGKIIEGGWWYLLSLYETWSLYVKAKNQNLELINIYLVNYIVANQSKSSSRKKILDNSWTLNSCSMKI